MLSGILLTAESTASCFHAFSLFFQSNPFHTNPFLRNRNLYSYPYPYPYPYLHLSISVPASPSSFSLPASLFSCLQRQRSGSIYERKRFITEILTYSESRENPDCFASFESRNIRHPLSGTTKPRSA